MKITRTTDLILHVFFPLTTGVFLYYGAGQGWFSQFVKSYLPDGLWAFAFISAILIIWDRKMPVYWMVVALLSLVLVEIFQLMGLMAGTADIWDVILYLFFAVLALFINHFLIKKKS